MSEVLRFTTLRGDRQEIVTDINVSAPARQKILSAGGETNDLKTALNATYGYNSGRRGDERFQRNQRLSAIRNLLFENQGVLALALNPSHMDGSVGIIPRLESREDHLGFRLLDDGSEPDGKKTLTTGFIPLRSVTRASGTSEPPTPLAFEDINLAFPIAFTTIGKGLTVVEMFPDDSVELHIGSGDIYSQLHFILPKTQKVEAGRLSYLKEQFATFGAIAMDGYGVGMDPALEKPFGTYSRNPPEIA